MTDDLTTGEGLLLSLLLEGAGRQKYNVPIGGKTRLVKELFLLWKVYGVNTGYEFIPYYFGPFSPEIYRDLARLEAIGFIKIEPAVSGNEISLTPEGVKRAGEARAKLPESTVRSLVSCKEQYNRMPLKELIDYVYTRWPKFTDKSLNDPDIMLKELSAEFDRAGITDEDISETIAEYRKEKKSKAKECA